MLFEELGKLDEDRIEIVDKADQLTDEEDDDEDDENDVEEGADEIGDIYDDLKGNKPLLSVADIRDWADVQDMLETGEG